MGFHRMETWQVSTPSKSDGGRKLPKETERPLISAHGVLANASLRPRPSLLITRCGTYGELSP